MLTLQKCMLKAAGRGREIRECINWILENRFKLQTLLFCLTRVSFGISPYDHCQLMSLLTGWHPGSVLADNLCRQSLRVWSIACFSFRDKVEPLGLHKEARKTRQKKKPNPEQIDRAHQKAEAANGTDVNKNERLKYGIKKGSRKAPEKHCAWIYPSHTSELIHFNSIILEANKLINLDLYHQ